MGQGIYDKMGQLLFQSGMGQYYKMGLELQLNSCNSNPQGDSKFVGIT